MSSDNSLNTINHKLLVVSLVPLALLGITLGWYMISMQFSELQSNLYDRGRDAAMQTASSAKFALHNDDRQMLERLGDSVLELPLVTGVIFTSYRDGHTLSLGDIDLDIDQMPDGFDNGPPFSIEDHWYFYSDIIYPDASRGKSNQIVQSQPQAEGWVLLKVTGSYLFEEKFYVVLTTVSMVILVLLLTFWISTEIGRLISRPVESLTQVVEQMERGNLNSVADRGGLYELDKLADGINSLASSVRQSNIRMETEIELATSQLQMTLAELEEAMQAKDQFVARMSHELRTPLTAVMGFTNLLTTENNQAERRKHLRLIQRSSAMLLAVIDDILDFSKADVGGFTLSNADFNLEKLVEDTTTVARKMAEDKGLVFEVMVAEDVPRNIHGDEVRLAQVLFNLFNNAIKFTDKGSVQFKLNYIDNTDNRIILEFSVKDTGKGIAEEKISTLFDPFVQEDDSINRRFGGSGIGLSIAQSLVQAMDGEIVINSEVDKGSTVTFTAMFLPTNLKHVEESGDREEPIPERGLLGVSILVAEDNPFNQKLLLKILQGQGASCLVSETGLEAIEQVKSSRVDLVLMDMHMPEVDGIVACETIVGLGADSPPIIGLTADITESEQQKMILAGALNVLLKPIDEVQLINAIFDALKKEPPNPVRSGTGLLESVIPIKELKVALINSLDQLEESLTTNSENGLRVIIHDLMGLCGLYGMSELRELVLDLKVSHRNLNIEQNLHKVYKIRKHIEEYPMF